MKELETVEQVYDRIAPNMSKAWGKKDVAMMVAKVYAAQFQPQWIKINSEADLPKEIVSCWFKRNGSNEVEAGLFMPRGDGNDSIVNDVLQNCTWYSLIIKPQPPKED